MFKNIFTNSFGILISRITGFFRDFLQASILGANIYTDIFIVAFKLPNLFRRIFGEGAFSQSFIPTFAKSKQKPLFAVSVLIRFLAILTLVTISVYLFSPYYTKLLAWGFDKKTILEASKLVTINFHYLLLIFSVTFLASLLQYKNHFITTAFSTALLNISMISALLLSKGLNPKDIVYNLSFAVVIGGILQLLAHLIAIKVYKIDRFLKVGFLLYKRKKSKIQNDMKKFNKGFIASVIGGSTAQVSAFLDGILASFLVAGSISHLFYANRIFQFPLALFAIATSLAIFPKIAKLINSNQEDSAKELLKKSAWLLIFLLTLATVVGVIFSKEIIYIILQRGAFSANDTIITSNTLIMFLVGLIPFGLAKIFSLWLYSNHRQNKAAKISAISLICNIIFSLLLIAPLKVEGLALSSSLSGIVLLILTIKEFGIKNFLDILWYKRYIFIYIVFVIAITILTFTLKGFLSAYIQL